MRPAELLGIAIGCVLLALGALSVVAWMLRRRSSERLLALFGVSCALYAVRLLAGQPAVRSAIGGRPVAWVDLVAIVTYVINVPIGLFFEALIGPGWRKSIRRIWQVQAVYAVAAIVVDVAVRPLAAMPANSPIVLAGVVLALPNLWMYGDRVPPLFRSRAIGIGRR